MVSLRRVIVVTVLSFLLSIAMFSQKPSDVSGWQNSRWGMTQGELAVQFPELRKVEKRETYSKDRYAEYQLVDYQIEDVKYSVKFLMGNQSGRLEQVVVRLTDKKAEGVSKFYFERLDSLLTQKYGQPDYRNSDVSRLSADSTRRWSFPTTLIELNYLTSSFVTLVTISYSERNGSDLDKV